MIDNKICSFEDFDNPGQILDHSNKKKEEFYVGTNAEKPVLIPEITDLAGYYGILNDYSDDIPGALREIELSALREEEVQRFPLHIKLRTSSNTLSDKKFVICNADEGDPGAYSDKWLLEKRPHSILFGMIITGLIIGADTGVIYI